jgi:hypothetical protein
MIRSTNNNQQLKQILAEELSKELPIDEIAEQDIPVEANRTQTQQVILTERQQTKTIETLTAQLLQNQLPKLDTASMKRVIAQQSQTPLSELSAQVRNLAEHIQVLPESNPLLEVFQQLEMALSKAEGSPLPSGMDMRAALDVMGEADQVEQTLHQTISANVTQPANQKAASDPLQEIIRQFAMMLSALQGRPGQSPLGYSPEAFDPKKSAEKRTSKNEGNSESGEISETENSYGSGDPAAQEKRLEEAKKLKDGGGLAGSKTDESQKPKLSESEQKAIAAKVAAADDDGSAAIANDPETLKILTPEQKGALIRELMDGHTSDSEDRAIAKILQSCDSKKEWDTVLQLSGGHKVFEELDDDGAKNMFRESESKWNNAEKEGAKKGIDLLEKCENPE